jgi:hypothetical protein
MTRSLFGYPLTRSWLQPKSWHAALGMLGFFPPVFGVLPRSCEPNGPGGSGTGGSSAGDAGSGGSSAGDAGSGGSSAGEAGQGGSSAGDAGSGGSFAGASGAGAEAGAGGETETPGDRVVEPLLGCVSGVSGKATPGAFDVIEPFYEMGQPADQRWLTDWSGDGQTAVGLHTNPPFEDNTVYAAFFVTWRAASGWELDAKVRIELNQFNEPPTYLTNCDDRVQVQRDGSGRIWSNISGLAVGFVEPGLFHDDLVLSEDGSAISFRTG